MKFLILFAALVTTGCEIQTCDTCVQKCKPFVVRACDISYDSRVSCACDTNQRAPIEVEKEVKKP